MKVTYESVAKMGANIVVSEENKNTDISFYN